MNGEEVRTKQKARNGTTIKWTTEQKGTVNIK